MLCMKSRCGSKIFDTKPARMWSNLMCNAEGPEAFELGYQQMQRIFSNDPERLVFMHELYQGPLFKKIKFHECSTRRHV